MVIIPVCSILHLALTQTQFPLLFFALFFWLFFLLAVVPSLCPKLNCAMRSSPVSFQGIYFLSKAKVKISSWKVHR